MTTPKEIILAKREGFQKAIELLSMCGWQATLREYRGRMNELYPLPTVSVPRIIDDPHTDTIQWRCINGLIEARSRSADPDRPTEWRAYPLSVFPGGRVLSPAAPTRERVRLWADLLERPIEEAPETEWREAQRKLNEKPVFVGNAQTRHHTHCAFRKDESKACTCSVGFQKSLYRELCERENEGAGEAGGLLHVPSKRREIL